MTMAENPLREILQNQLPEIDFGVMKHGFADHGRDYVFVVQNSFEVGRGTYELTFTHVVQLNYETRVRDEVWRRSWGDEFTDYSAWQAAGEPGGYVFGTNWSLAYPGITILDDHADALSWSRRLSRPMHAAQIETDRFSILLVYGGAQLSRLSSDASTVGKVIIPLDEWPGGLSKN